MSWEFVVGCMAVFLTCQSARWLIGRENFTSPTPEEKESESDRLFGMALDGVCGNCAGTNISATYRGLFCLRCYHTFKWSKAHVARQVQEYRMKKIVEDKP